MRTSVVLVLGALILLVSFFVFHHDHEITGLVFGESSGKVVTSRFVEVPGFTPDADNVVTVLYSVQQKVKRGGNLVFYADPSIYGVRSKGRVLDSKGEVVQHFFICGKGLYALCMHPKRMVLTVSKSGFFPGEHTVEVTDGSGKIVRLSFTVV